jgi:hypothetical protein
VSQKVVIRRWDSKGKSVIIAECSFKLGKVFIFPGEVEDQGFITSLQSEGVPTAKDRSKRVLPAEGEEFLTALLSFFSNPPVAASWEDD